MARVIRVEGLSKRYRLGSIGHGSLVKDLQSWWARFRGRPDPNSPLHAQRPAGDGVVFWALRDVGFEVEKGEMLGLIGRNGSGKSTLLKILSQVTGPTTGTVQMRGRIASLLEVGTGFHRELTGRENVFLNGAIHGMRRAEVRAKLDRIVAFAEVEKFIDTPVKRYSSGMYVRLAFSVAAHLEPDILVIDEVLAVGDLNFQRKCYDHLRGLRKKGTTIILVSHNMSVIRQFCTRTLLLERGNLLFNGDNADAVVAYQRVLREQLAPQERSVEADPCVQAVELVDADGTSARQFRYGARIGVQIRLHSSQPRGPLRVSVVLRRIDGVIALRVDSGHEAEELGELRGTRELEIWLPVQRLLPDAYTAEVQLLRADANEEPWDVSAGIDLSIISGPGDGVEGVLLPAQQWRCLDAGL